MSLRVAEAPVPMAIVERFQLLVRDYQRSRPFNRRVVRQSHADLAASLFECVSTWPALLHRLTMTQKLWLFFDDLPRLYPVMIRPKTKRVKKTRAPSTLKFPKSSPDVSVAA